MAAKKKKKKEKEESTTKEISLDLLNWKGKKETKNWEEFCAEVAGMVTSIPSSDPEEFALITRAPEDKESKGEVITTSEPKDLVAMAVSPDIDFAAKWFIAYDTRIAVLLTVLSGDKRGTHYLIGPNKFPTDMQNHLNFMRSMEKASDNLGT